MLLNLITETVAKVTNNLLSAVKLKEKNKSTLKPSPLAAFDLADNFFFACINYEILTTNLKAHKII